MTRASLVRTLIRGWVRDEETKWREERKMKQEIAAMSPNEAWETYVGAQSTSEFMEYSSDGEATPREAALEYVQDPTFQRDMNVPDDSSILQALAEKLAEHIEECQS